MPSKTQHKIQFARERGVYVFKMPKSLWPSLTKDSWNVWVEGEDSPRGIMSKRAAKNLAYAISVSKVIPLEVVFSSE